MTVAASMPLIVLLSSLVPAVLIFLLREDQQRLRTGLNLGGALLKLAVVGYMLWGVFHDQAFILRIPFLPGLPLTLHADALSMFLMKIGRASCRERV